MPFQLDQGQLLETVQLLRRLYQGFPWESQLWPEHGPRRSPYRVLILFGLSARTRDALLVDVCRRFFGQFPDLPSLLSDWPNRPSSAKAIVRRGQVAFVESAIRVIEGRGGVVPRDRELLLGIMGVGEKVVECVLGYGWGQESLPMDGNGRRTLERIWGPPEGVESRRTSDLRRRLNAILGHHRDWMLHRGVAMIDVHELFRLHGQLVCTRKPLCSVCPVSCCRSRKHAYDAPAAVYFNPNLWEEWRELLLEPG